MGQSIPYLADRTPGKAGFGDEAPHGAIIVPTTFESDGRVEAHVARNHRTDVRKSGTANGIRGSEGCRDAAPYVSVTSDGGDGCGRRADLNQTTSGQ